ncbi:metal tolerance protein [Basidiobolus meristosporus CBS 931.73]|uniref:Metal tolerance protein n=1 Tax=Basidiobolus meristosporus CBS 931.73 TaxID=1314790 RepID=A0A1Y1Z3W7_9FUNG|nr:metal tolerance protein [Basidiobolus meristosporus CBS 931.73]|eukprot:ORY04804.1 metal tolerance protein [Basidiobolus meristosporus CBS 931.73]
MSDQFFKRFLDKYTSTEDLKRIKGKHVRRFYQGQNEQLERFEEVDDILSDTKGLPRLIQLPETNLETTPLINSNRNKQVSWAINISFLANICLFVMKVYMTLSSGSLAILVSALDSFLDIMAGTVIFCTSIIIRRKNFYKYPIGKSRMEPLSIVVFAAVTATSLFQVIIESFKNLLSPDDSDISMSISTGIFLGIVIVNMTVQTLAQDHGNDVVFNTLAFIFPLIAGVTSWWWIDSVGAIILAILFIYNWIGVCLENIIRLTGHTASTQEIQQLVYMILRYNPCILEVETLRAYYVGENIHVEAHIVLPPGTSLKESHDIGEDLQITLEQLPNVRPSICPC